MWRISPTGDGVVEKGILTAVAESGEEGADLFGIALAAGGKT
jgi:hypothetical protein